MSLTNSDLKAIKDLVRDTVQPMIDKLDDSLSIQTAKGFAAVDTKFAAVDARFAAIDTKFDKVEDYLGGKIDKLERKVDTVLDDHEVRISNLEKA